MISAPQRPWWPRTVFVAKSACDDTLTRRVISRLPNCEVRTISDGTDPFSEEACSDNNLSDSERFSLGKQALLLTRYQGEWLRSCPGTAQHVCCNLWTINPGEGCPFDCTYCYLQSYLRRNPTLKIFTNTPDMLEAIENKVCKDPSRLFRITTGEVVDSLVWDELTDRSRELIACFARFPNAILELKTKSSSIENILDMKNVHQGKTVVSWSVNARTICEKDELFTATLDERIEAAEKAVEAGYRIGFHFDPLVHFPGWEDEYSDTIKQLFRTIKPENIAWISVASLRYAPQMQEIMRERFPESFLPFGEQFLAKDHKLRYIQPVRFKMTEFVWGRLKEISQDLPVYMCMESAAAWRNIAGGPPVAGTELAEVFSRQGQPRLPILNSR
jgi:spore photoproduct lyase